MKKSAWIIIAVVVIVLIILLIAFFSSSKKVYSFKDDTFYYSQNRPLDYNLALKERDYQNSSCDLYSVNFQSRDFLDYKTHIYGFIFIPNNNKTANQVFPGLVLLPGGNMPKESESVLASKICDLGYAVLTYDQRGIGQTGGAYLGLEQDYAVFSQGKEPIQHLCVYDSLIAFDVMRKIKSVDKDNIAIAGESMGGRYAIIAAALDKRLKGVLAISTSGFHVNDTVSFPYTPYFLSIDPDHYISKISPNKVYMLQGDNDTTVNLDDAKATFNLANEPKRFFVANGCGHGYCSGMYNELKEDLRWMFEK